MSPLPDVTTALDPCGITWATRGRRLNYAVAGTGDSGTVLLISGLGMQRTEWTPQFVAALLRRGYRVLLADNPGCGRSVSSRRPLTLPAMADDLIDLVHHLSVAPVHLVGISMGGMIAQHLALRAPELCGSLTSLMSTTGRRGVGRPAQQAKWIFSAPVPTDTEEEYVEYAVRHHEAIAGERYLDIPLARTTASLAYERGVRPDGTAAQLAAIRVDGDRTDRLQDMTVPTLVLHGDSDPMIDLSGGRDTASAIPAATLHIMEGLGHTIPSAEADNIARLIDAHIGRTVRST